MRFAVQFWLWIVPLLPLVWLALRWSDGRARSRLVTLLGVRGAEHIEGANPRLRGWRRFLLLSALFWLLLALARPQWGASEVTVTQRGSDVVVALDISNSMLAEDVVPDRMERAKTELTSFLRRLEDSRVGLVFFAGASFVQCPLTLDYGTAEIFLKMAGPDMLSEQGTDIGGALRTSRELLAKGREGAPGGTFQAILLVTDGEDLEGAWRDEANACRDEGIRVIPVGVGDEGGGLIPVQDLQGRPAGFLKDEDGNVVTTHLDLASLEELAGIGGGSAFRIGVDGLAGDRLHAELQRLGRRDLEERRISAYEERFVYPLLLAVACLLIRMALRPRRRSTAPVLAILALGWALWPAAAGASVLREGAAEMEKGRAAYAEEDYEWALANFESAMVLAPDDPVISLALGETLHRLERYDEAAAEFARALELAGDDELAAEALYNQGTSRLAAGALDQAIEALKASLAIEPEREDALVNLETAVRLKRIQEQQQQQQQEQEQEQQQDEQNEQDENEEQEQQDQQQQSGDQQNDEQPEDQQQDGAEDQPQPEPQDQQPEQQEQQQQPPAEQPEDQPEPEQEEQPEPEVDELTRDQALQILNALDRDEEELKRSVRKRLQGGKPKSGKKW